MVAVQLDVTDDASVKAAAKEISEYLEKGRGLDILVNNAGVLLQKSDDEEEKYDAATGRKTVEVNFEGTVRVTEAMMPLLLLQRGGGSGVEEGGQHEEAAHVVNVSSGVGTRTLARIRPEQRAALVDASLELPALREFCAAALAELEKDESSPYHAIPTVSYGISKLAVNCYTQMMARRYGTACRKDGDEAENAASNAALASAAASTTAKARGTARVVRFNAASPGFTNTRMCDGYTGERQPKSPSLGASVFRDVLFSDLGKGKNGKFFKQADKAGTQLRDASSREEPWVAL